MTAPASSGSCGPVNHQEPPASFSHGRTAKLVHPSQEAQHRPAGASVPLKKLTLLLFPSLDHSKSTDEKADEKQNSLVLEFGFFWEIYFPGKGSYLNTEMQPHPRLKCILLSHLASVQPGRCNYPNDTSCLQNCKGKKKKSVHFGDKPPLPLCDFMLRRESKPHSSLLQKGRLTLCNLCHWGCFLTIPKLLYHRLKTMSSCSVLLPGAKKIAVAETRSPQQAWQ